MGESCYGSSWAVEGSWPGCTGYAALSDRLVFLEMVLEEGGRQGVFGRSDRTFWALETGWADCLCETPRLYDPVDYAQALQVGSSDR